MKEKMGMMAGKTMTREEAMAILNIEEGDKLDSEKESEPELDEEGYSKETLDPELIMKRFETMIEKNQVANGGSFYI